MLVEALQGQEMEVVDRIDLVPAEGRGATRGGPRSSRRARLAVPAQPHEDVVLLVEQEGVYAWSYGSRRQAPAGRRTRGGPASGAVHFELDLVTAAAVRAPSRGLVKKLVPKAARVVVLRFAARIAVGAAMRFLERHVESGLRLVAGEDPSSWSRIDDFARVVPTDKPAKVLLLVHGTFSTTVGSFGDLGASAWGRELLGAAFARYDAVVGYDHATLSEDPAENATDLYSRLSGDGKRSDLTVDAVCYSRGGLVYRSLAEHVAPLNGWSLGGGATAFVGCPNEGTPLAETDRWKTYIDLYTNLSAAAMRIVGLFPHLAAGAEIARAAIKSLGAFVKYVAAYATSEDDVPGIASMRPGSTFLSGLNQSHPHQPAPGYGRVYAVTSDFEAHLKDGQPSEFPKRFLMNLADGAVDRFMGRVANDIVVPSGSATAIHPELAGFINAELDFGRNPNVYHTNYFTRPETANALGRWFGLARESILVSDPDQPPQTVGPEPPPSVDGEVVVADAGTRASAVRQTLLHTSPSFLVVTGVHRGVRAMRADAALEALGSGRGGTAESALDLTSVSPALTLDLDEFALEAPTVERRTVIMDAGAPVGVAEPAGATDSVGLARAARRVEGRGRTPTRTRLMPSAAPVGPAATVEALQRRPGTSGGAKRSTPQRKPAGGGGRGRAASRTATGARRPAAARRSTSTVPIYLASEMPSDVVVDERVTISVKISRNKLTGAVGETGGRVRARRQPLLIQVMPKENLELLDEGRAEIDLPSEDTVELLFDVKALASGRGEVWVYARQGAVVLLRMRLVCNITRKRKSGPGRRVTEAHGEAVPGRQLSLDTLWIIERQVGDQITFDYRLELNSIGAWSGPAESKRIDKGAREAYVGDLYEELESNWSSAGDDPKAFEALVRSFGGELLDQLMPTEFQAALWKFRRQIGNVVVMSEEPFIPWELVHLKPPGGDFPRQSMFLGQLGVVRWPINCGYPPSKLTVRKGKAFYVMPSYPDYEWELPEVEDERAFLEQTVQARPVEPQPTALLDLLKDPDGFDLLHFAGHGDTGDRPTDQARLFLEGTEPGDGEEYRPPALLASQVKQLTALRDASSIRPIVVLNACRTGRQASRLSSMGGFADAFISRGAGAVVSSLWAVGDIPALRFVEELYPRLQAGKEVGLAVREARAAARKAGDATWLAYAVYANPHATVKFR